MQQIAKDKNNKAFGLFFIFLGITYILFSYFLNWLNVQQNWQLAQFSDMAVATKSIYSNFSSQFYSVFVSVVPYLSIFLGALICSKKSNVKATMITGIILHAFYVLSIIIVNYIAYSEPESIFLMYGYDIEKMARIIKEVVLPQQILPTAFYLIYSFAFIVVSTIFLAGKRHNNNQNTKTSGVVGIILMLIAFAVINLIKAPLNNTLIVTNFSLNTIAAKNSADGMFVLSFVHPMLLSFIISAPLMFEKIRRNKLLLISIGTIIAMGLADLIFSVTTMEWLYGVSTEIHSETLIFIIQKTFMNVLKLISFALWFDSVERKTAPLWLQISLPVTVPVLWYVFASFIEIPLIYFLKSTCFIDLALILIYVIIIVVSLIVTKKRKWDYISQ